MAQKSQKSGEKTEVTEPKVEREELPVEATTELLRTAAARPGPPGNVAARQTQLLGDGRLDRRLRQELAVHIGRTQGNRHLQLVLRDTHGRQRTPPDPRPSEDNLQRAQIGEAQHQDQAEQQPSGDAVKPVSPVPQPGTVVQRTPRRVGVSHRPEGVYYHPDRIDVVVEAQQGDDFNALLGRADDMLAGRLEGPQHGYTTEAVMERLFPGGGRAARARDLEITVGENYVSQYFTEHLERADRVRIGLAIASADVMEEYLGSDSGTAGPGTEGDTAEPGRPLEETPEGEGGPRGEGEEEGEVGDPMQAFLERFEQAATLITQEILNQAEQIVLQEQERYTGIRAERVEEPGGEEGAAAARTSRRGRYSRTHAGAHVGAESRAREERGHLAERVHQTEAGEESPRRTTSGRGMRELEARRAIEREFPILTALSIEEFADVGTAGEEQQRILERHISERLEAIRTVRNGLGGEFNVWLNQRVVMVTKQQLGIQSNSREDLWVEFHRRGVRTSEAVRDFFLGALSFAFSILAAAATAGLSFGLAAILAGAAVATGLAEVAGEIEEYQMGLATARTHFDRDEALTQCDPSAMWLALSIVGLFLDVTEFVVAVRMLARLARPITAAVQAAEGAGTVIDAARRTELLDEFEGAARLEYGRLRALDSAEDAAILADVSEQRFLAQVLEPARRQLEAAGGGVRRGTAATMSHSEMLTIFTRATRRPGPGAEVFRVYRTEEEFAEAWWRAYPDDLGDAPLGFVVGGRIHLPPDADTLTVIHESLHWASNQAGFRGRMGAFVEEGMTESLARRIGGPDAARIYEANVGFAEALRRAVGPRTLDNAYLHGQWGPLDGALHTGFGNQARLDEFYRLIRTLNAQGQPAENLARAREMLGSFSEAPALPLTPVPPG